MNAYKKYFKSHDNKQPHLLASDMMLFRIIFVSMRNAGVGTVLSKQYSPYLNIFSHTWKCSGFKGR